MLTTLELLRQIHLVEEALVDAEGMAHRDTALTILFGAANRATHVADAIRASFERRLASPD
jgi:hypothetical protein